MFEDGKKLDNDDIAFLWRSDHNRIVLIYPTYFHYIHRRSLGFHLIMNKQPDAYPGALPCRLQTSDFVPDAIQATVPIS